MLPEYVGGEEDPQGPFNGSLKTRGAVVDVECVSTLNDAGIHTKSLPLINRASFNSPWGVKGDTAVLLPEADNPCCALIRVVTAS
jgi:hypothetical protein